MLITHARYLLLIAIFSFCQPARADHGDHVDHATAKRPLFLFLLVHDDVQERNNERLAHDYFSWLVKDLESFTDRRVVLEFVRNVPGLTDFSYRGEQLDAIWKPWQHHIDQYLDRNNLPRNGTTKYVLLTQDRINSSILGFTIANAYTGIASLETFTAPAHELGHMFGGTHESAEVIYRNGWWCETNLIEARNSLRANCYAYSDENRARITEYLSQFP
ncbi:hypothetical protein V2J66_16120 [Pseudomonas alliivorans]|nr:hypothetical protein [Pseudomonas alliivorans]MEE5054945.1 hypothetical protein [Pseudomonas alliivorans]MEE5084488.1 hypothetical protein [Pseudomonas alliivorans]MEE5127227.1 hypothetical protein [Pseudomonas alliivorans]MEE5164237.1 hypothetical protein [Pseudomonas alliivorans]